MVRWTEPAIVSRPGVLLWFLTTEESSWLRKPQHQGARAEEVAGTPRRPARPHSPVGLEGKSPRAESGRGQGLGIWNPREGQG